MDDATELRSFLSKDLIDWLQGSDALDACDALLLSASDVYENLHTDHTPSLPVPPIPRPYLQTRYPTTCTTTHYEYTQASTVYMHWLTILKTQQDTDFCTVLHWQTYHFFYYIRGNMLYLLIRQHEKRCNC